MTDSYQHRFGGIGRLYGTRALERFRAARVAVVGVGGVGSWTVEALARSGVGALTLVDLDEVCLSNANRQLHALDGTVGRPKIDVLAERVAAINPQCSVRPVLDFFTERSAAAILSDGDAPFDVVVDAIDQPKHKQLLIDTCLRRGMEVVVVGGAGGKRDPTAVRAADIVDVTNDMLLKRVRKFMRQKMGYPRGDTPWGLRCVYSTENAVFPAADGGVCATPDPASSLRMDCASGYGAASFVTGTFGFVAASEALRILAAA